MPARVEPDWEDVQRRLGALTIKELKVLKPWFNGSLGGASSKADIAREMTSQMRYWWHECYETHGHIVRSIVAKLNEVT